MITVGVAIPVPAPWGPELDAARAGTGDPQGVHVPAHVTLLGPTEIPTDSLPAVEEHLKNVAAAAHSFGLHLRGTGSFRPVTEVVFVTVATGISECEQLESAVRAGPLARELNYPYHPHVTVAQAVDTAALDRVYEDLADFSAQFDVTGFVLYTHEADATWRPRREFRFADSTE